MSSTDKTLLCRYHYDPLDRLVDCTPSAQARTQRFYLKERLTSEIQGSVQRSIFQQADQLLAQQQRQDGAVETTLLATDQQRSVLHALDTTQPHPLAYTPYGHRPAENGLLSLLGFNGEQPDPVTGHYLLGNGYRAFNPTLMRFNSPDSMSPFGRGGLNPYAYGQGDPINTSDPTGHFNIFTSPVKATLNWMGVRKPKNVFIVHGIELRISPRKAPQEFIRDPMKPFLPAERPMTQEIIDAHIPELERSLYKDSLNIIKLETQAAQMLKPGRVAHNKVVEFSRLLDVIQVRRGHYRENLEDYAQRLNPLLPPPPYSRPPSYQEQMLQSSENIRA
ncbi:RHS repeat-associated core domain-containing protein [Pseudomonas sp. Z1-12]|uniref:RHS repeat-associated core domain-containing protein n=1 Tax=Pseudomonas sp. Z1-12 TaxID=2817408 RepID=UPI003DA8000D